MLAHFSNYIFSKEWLAKVSALGAKNLQSYVITTERMIYTVALWKMNYKHLIKQP